MFKPVMMHELRHLEWYLIANMLLIFAIGMLTLFSATSSFHNQAAFMEKQMFAFVFGAGIAAILLCIDYRRVAARSRVLYLAVLMLIGLVLLIGVIAGGARRWIVIFGFSLQPSEFMKPALVLLIAQMIAIRQEQGTRLLGFRELLMPFAAALVPVILIIMQPDLGTAIIILLSALIMFWFARLKWHVYAVSGLVGLISAPMLWTFVLQPYQKVRILRFFESLWNANSREDALGVDYHALQAKIAIGSGGLLGKGYMAGTQHHLRFIPEHHTDFIFTVFAEEWGFIGCIVLLLLFVSLCWRIVEIARRAGDNLGSMIAIGLGSIFFLQFVINLLMVMRWAPVVGIPLPLFSYGGSSLVSMLICVGILLSISARRYRH